MAAKIKQIAEIAQVSPATVSLALNNKPGVSPATRARILTIAEDLKIKNGNASFTTLIKGSVRFLKIVKHSHIVNRDHDVFIAAYVEGMDKEARKYGYNLEITHITIDQAGDFISHLNSSSSKGLIILGTELNAQDIHTFESVNVPIVVIDTTYDFIQLDFVDMNNVEALFQIVKFLKENNHRDIGMIWGEGVEAEEFRASKDCFRAGSPLLRSALQSEEHHNGRFNFQRGVSGSFTAREKRRPAADRALLGERSDRLGVHESVQRGRHPDPGGRIHHWVR